MKWLKRVLLFVIVGITVTYLASIILNVTYRTTFEKLSATDQQMLTELATIYQHFEKSSDQLWNTDYHFENEPLIVIQSNKSNGIIRQAPFVINVKGMEDRFFAKEIEMPASLQLPKIYRLHHFDLSTLTSWAPWNFGEVKMKGTKTFYLKYYPKMFSDPHLYFDFSSFLLHESFHAYKQRDWIYDKNGVEHIIDYPVDKENYALMGLEFTLLDKAMATKNPSIIKQLLQDWTIIRNYRYHKWPQLIGETKAEAIEGSARYLEYSYSKLNGGNLTVLATKHEPYHITFMQAFHFIANGQAESPTFLERDIRYETGAALGLLMDNANIPWKDAIEDHVTKRGKTQFETLKVYFQLIHSSDYSKHVENIKRDNDYRVLLEQGERLVRIYHGEFGGEEQTK